MRKRNRRLIGLIAAMMAVALLPVLSFGDTALTVTLDKNEISVTEGAIHKNSDAVVTASGNYDGPQGGSFVYNWYSCDASGVIDEPVADRYAEGNLLRIPEELTAGEHYYLCKVQFLKDMTTEVVETKNSGVVKVTVAVGKPVVIFDANGGNFAETGETVKETKITDGKVSDPGIPGMEGFRFTGWWTTPYIDGEQISDVGAYEFTHTTRLYARYDVEKTAIFDANGGSFEEGVTEYYISFFGDFVSKDELPPDPTREGYVFAGWYLKGGDGEEYALTPIPGEDGYEFPSDGMIIYAKWSKLDDSPAAGDKNNMLPWMLAAGLATLSGSAVRFGKKSI